jgi:L-serine/L-threonine ammonia-lyase
VETRGADSFAQSLREARRVELPAITSVATSLGAKRVAERAFDWAKEHPIQSVVVSDRTAVAACFDFLDDHRLLTEPACGASLSVIYDGSPLLAPFATVLVIVCGGATATLEQLQQWSRQQ